MENKEEVVNFLRYLFIHAEKNFFQLIIKTNDESMNFPEALKNRQSGDYESPKTTTERYKIERFISNEVLEHLRSKYQPVNERKSSRKLN